ncbi:hypothetical protein BEL01nite_64030 [Bradyrhizobium elkanii]|nr:hypothetical protein BEL01nite_64030 [Bradyrhizobium elkanii]
MNDLPRTASFCAQITPPDDRAIVAESVQGGDERLVISKQTDCVAEQFVIAELGNGRRAERYRQLPQPARIAPGLFLADLSTKTCLGSLPDETLIFPGRTIMCSEGESVCVRLAVPTDH